MDPICGEGRSARQLRQKRPDLFKIPGSTSDLGSGWPVQKPLMGEDLYVYERDFRRYAVAVRRYWSAVATRLDRLPWRG
jgi:hypothetical protein